MRSYHVQQTFRRRSLSHRRRHLPLIAPSGSLVSSTNIYWNGANAYQNFQTPGYTFDILLRIRRLTTGTPCP